MKDIGASQVAQPFILRLKLILKFTWFFLVLGFSWFSLNFFWLKVIFLVSISVKSMDMPAFHWNQLVLMVLVFFAVGNETKGLGLKPCLTSCLFKNYINTWRKRHHNADTIELFLILGIILVFRATQFKKPRFYFMCPCLKKCPFLDMLF